MSAFLFRYKKQGKARTCRVLHRINIKEFEVSLVQSFPKPLSAKEEKECIVKCRSGDREARDCLIERNLRLVAYIAKKYNMGDKDMDDLISIGTIGLIKGIDSFDETKNIRLATYAARCIEKPIQQKGSIMQRHLVKGILCK